MIDFQTRLRNVITLWSRVDGPVQGDTAIEMQMHILMGKRNVTIEFCQVKHVVHKHELTMTRTLSKASRLFEFIDFCLSGMLANMNILTTVTNCISF